MAVEKLVASCRNMRNFILNNETLYSILFFISAGSLIAMMGQQCRSESLFYYFRA